MPEIEYLYPDGDETHIAVVMLADTLTEYMAFAQMRGLTAQDAAACALQASVVAVSQMVEEIAMKYGCQEHWAEEMADALGQRLQDAVNDSLRAVHASKLGN